MENTLRKSRMKILLERLQMLDHNLLCYSDNYMCSEPKAKYVKEWTETKNDIDTIEHWIREIE